MKKDNFIDDPEDIELIEAYERGECVEVENMAEEIAILKVAADNYLKKNARINIRIPQGDLYKIKDKAAQEGMPYQTLISSLLHKFVTGQVKFVNA